MCFEKPRLYVNFRYLKKTDSQYWSNFARNERRTQSATGLAVPHLCVTQNNIPSTSRMFAYAKLTVGRTRIEIPIGCYSEPSLVFHYKGSASRNPRSGYPVVDYTGFVAKTVAFDLFDAYDDYRIWRLSRQMIEFTRKLTFKLVLESGRSVEDFTRILSPKYETVFQQLLQHRGSRSRRCDHSDKLGKRASAT